MEEIKKVVQAAAKELFNVEVEPDLSRPDEQFGDYATNMALQLGKKLNKNPREVAQALAEKIKDSNIEKTEVAGPGFINITLSEQTLIKLAHTKPSQINKNQKILVEFGDPNPFKEMHIGHLYSAIAGDAISNVIEASGAEVKRLSYHGDVGLNVAKAIWGMQKDGFNLSNKQNIGRYYALGSEAYDKDSKAKEQIDKINEHVYKRDDQAVNKLYDEGRQASFRNFDEIYELLGIKYDKRYLESQSAETGTKYVMDNKDKVFKQSQGAIVYEGEKVGLHTRVFITSKGIPTYEAKDLGLTELKNKDYPDASRSIIITANEQAEYFKVMLAALAEIDKPLADKTTHLSHGFVSLTSGKMSSRSGNVYGGMQLLLDVKKIVHEQYPDSKVRKEVTLAAVKYTFLKHRLGSDIVFDVKESVSLEGNSGPYLQYAHARARSILKKSQQKPADEIKNLQPEERSLVRKITEYPEIIDKAVNELMPHHICTYLYELAQTFNSFYEKNRVIGDPRELIRLKLIETYADVLKRGLELLNIAAPEKI